MRRRFRLTVAAIVGWLLTVTGATAGGAQAANAVIAGAVTAPAPTMRGLTIEWAFTGDADADAAVAVRVKPTAGGSWLRTQPLRRVAAGSAGGRSWAQRFSGSVFDLAPGTSYDVHLTLRDPDGGTTTRRLTVATRSIPTAAVGAPVRNATPGTLAATLAQAVPGDIVQLAAGSYGGFTIDRSGTAGLPIVVRGGPGVIVNGDVGVFQRAFVHVEQLTVNGRIRFNGSNDVSITRNTVNAQLPTGDGIVSYLRAERAYIADNTVVGTTAWVEAALGASGANLGEGILVTGPGHVIEHNRVRGFRDGISLLEGAEAVDQWSIDIHANDISEAADDAVEADFCAHNCRITANRVTNAFVAFSSQPGLGGPTWFVRNAAYNVAYVAFKLHNSSVGDVIMHNTVVKAGDAFGIYPGAPIAGLLSRNNLMIGGPGGTVNGFSNGSGRVMWLPDVVLASSSLDGDALGSTTGTFTGRLGATTFSSLVELQSGTNERRAVQVDLSVFAGAVTAPTPLTQYGPVDLRPRGDSTVVDRALRLPGINDVFTGSGPDAGAFEAGAPLPPYGPR
jgi:hypothetical protein